MPQRKRKKGIKSTHVERADQAASVFWEMRGLFLELHKKCTAQHFLHKEIVDQIYRTFRELHIHLENLRLEAAYLETDLRLAKHDAETERKLTDLFESRCGEQYLFGVVRGLIAAGREDIIAQHPDLEKAAAILEAEGLLDEMEEDEEEESEEDDQNAEDDADE